MTYSEVALKYCEDVVSGAISACQLVFFACQRHLNDLGKQSDPNYPYEFNPPFKDNKQKKRPATWGPADRRCAFSELFPHVKGKWSGDKLKLQPHQVFIECCLWGWVKKKNGKRRFSVAYIEIPRKNGKSMTAATAGLYMLTADGEKGAEIYSGASTEKQALEVFRPAWQMVNKMSDFRNKFGISLSGTPKNPTSIYRLEDMSRFELVVGNPPDGASPHCAIIDEYHEHRTSDQYDTMDTGMGARQQPLMFVITTAGTDTSSPCYEMHMRAVKVLNGTIHDDAFFTIIYTVDQDDDFKDFKVWEKANPNYLISIEEDYLYRKYTETMTDASKQNINLCKHLNIWSNAGVAWMNMVKWSACLDESLNLNDFKGVPCYAALDLASKIDICALTLLFDTEKGFVIFSKYYLPEETVNLPGNEHYVKWVKEGYITATPGARTDFLYIENDLKDINANHPIIELAYDPRESTYLINNVMEWIGSQWIDGKEISRCVEINQGPSMMSEPMKELEAKIYSQTIWQDGNPVTTWMMGNVVKKQGRTTGPVKYYYPTRQSDKDKIDGPVTIIMAVARAMLGGGQIGSAYDGLTYEEMKEKMTL